MTEIRNATADMTGPNSVDRLVLLAAGMYSGQQGINEFIAAQERAGQQQLVTFAPLTYEGRDHATFAACPDGRRSHADARFLMLPPVPEIASAMDGQHPLFETEGA